MRRERRLPAMPLFVSDFLGSSTVQQMEGEEAAAYLLALVHNWNLGERGLPAEEGALRRLLRFSEEGWRRVRGAVLGAFETVEIADEKRLQNTRVLRDRKRASEKSRGRSTAAKIRWQKEKGRMQLQSNCSAIGIVRARARSGSSSSSSSSSSEGGGAGGGRPVDWAAEAERWNELAERHGLPRLQRWNETRRRHLRARLREEPEFWTLLRTALERRDEWAREHAFPRFDQAIRPDLWTKLVEGHYADRSGGEWQSEALKRAEEEA